MMIKRLLNITVLTLIMLFTVVNSCQFKMGGQEKKQIIIPLDFSTQRPVLQLMIGDKGPYRFIFDTGSSVNVIDTELTAELGFEVIGEDSLGNPGSDNKVVSKRVKVPNVNFTNTDISEDALMNAVAIRKMVAVDGILSPVFFSKYLITVDYPGSILELSIGELDSTKNDVVPFIQNSRVINLNVSVAGHVVEAHLDSGNPGGFDLPFSMKDKLKFKKQPVAGGVINTVAASFKKWKATLDGNIKVGNITYEDPEVYLVEDFQFVNLGYLVFKDLRMTLDRQNHLIQFEKISSKSGMKEEEYAFAEQNEFTGWYGDRKRKIFLEKGEMYLQRGGAAKLKLIQLEENLFEMTFPVAVWNELPQVRFDRNASNKVIGLTFIFEDGREDFVKKDK